MKQVLGILLGLSACASTVALAQNEVLALGQNALGEECVSRPRTDLLVPAGLSTDSRLFCGKKLIGSVSHLPLKSIVTTDQATPLQTIQQSFVGSVVQKSIDARMSCSAPQPIQASSHAVAAPCQLKQGGWQHLVVMALADGEVKVLEGPPSSARLLFEMVGVPAEKAFQAASKESLTKLWGEPVVLASSNDLSAFRTLVQQGAQANAASNYAQAEDAYRKALALQTRFLSENDLAVANTLMDLAVTVSNQKKFDQAQALFRRAEPIIQKSPNDSDRARFAYYQGIEAANRGDYVAAAAFGGESVRLWRKTASQPGVGNLLSQGEDTLNAEKGELALALGFQGAMALRNEDFVTANVLTSESFLLMNSLDSVPEVWKANAMATLGEVSVAQGRLSAAETYFNSALAIRTRLFGEGRATWPLQASLGKAYQRESMNTSAIITFRRMFQNIAANPAIQPQFNADQLTPFTAALVDYADTLSSDSEKQGLFAEAFPAFQLVRSTVVDQTIQKAQARFGVSDPAVASLLERVQNLQRELDSLRVDLALEQALPDSERSAEVETRLQNNVRNKASDLNKAEADMLQAFPAYTDLINPQPLRLIDVRKSLADTEGLVSFLIGRDESFIQLTKRSGNYVARVKAGEAELQEMVTSLRRALEIQGGSVNEFDLGKSHLLYTLLFKALEPELQGVQHLVVAASGPLGSLPFGLLVTQPPASQNGYTQAKWLIKEMAISHAPSVQAFYSLRGAPAKAPAPKALLAFADPVLDGVSRDSKQTQAQCVATGPMNTDTLRALAPLPETTDEVRAVARVMGVNKSSLFFRERASENTLRNQTLADYRVLYFATHGLLPGELRCQAEPGLVLSPPMQQATQTESDGLLAASEIAQMKLNAELVVLSACNTAGGGGKFGGEALSGLAESFFYAGARGLVVSHWQVPSRATAMLLSNMFEFLGPDLKGGAALALREAQLKMISRQSESHPFFWAAFVLVGDGVAGGQAPVVKQAQIGVFQ